MTFDPKRPLVMAAAKTVLGHALPVGHPLTVVDEPTAAGEVDEAMARRLNAAGLAGYLDELHATPVETPEQERNRLALEAVREARRPGSDDTFTPTADLVTFPEGHAKAGKKVTKDDLIELAASEGAVVPSNAKVADLQLAIMEARASRAVANGTNAETNGAGGQGDTAAQGATGRSTAGGAGSAPQGDGDAD